jgi:hypothetical protein
MWALFLSLALDGRCAARYQVFRPPAVLSDLPTCRSSTEGKVHNHVHHKSKSYVYFYDMQRIYRMTMTELSSALTDLHDARFEVSRALSMKKTMKREKWAVVRMFFFWDIKTQFVLHRRHLISPLQSPAG